MTKLSCAKKTTSGRMLCCVILFPRLPHVVSGGHGGGGCPLVVGYVGGQ